MATVPCTKDNIDQLAGLFIAMLSRHMTDEQFKEFLRRTREDFQESTCHSHDFIDANMAMDDAFKEAFGESPQADSDEDMTLFNLAWDRAKNFIGGRL